ncbi:hypothetical protein D9M68_227080 [compost metagenome]
MNPDFVVRTILERRKGIDMIAMPYEQKTRFTPRNREANGAGAPDGDCKISH